MKNKQDVPRATLEQKQLKQIGRAFRIGRHDLSLKIMDVAEKSGVCTLTVSKLERGKLDNTTFQTINRIAEVLELKLTFTVDKTKKDANQF